MWTWLLEISTGLLGDAPPAPILSVSSKRPSPTVTCRCLLAPHRCGVQERCWVRGRTCADFSSPRIPMSFGEHDNTVHFPFTMTLWASDRLIRAAIMRLCLHMDFLERRNGQAHHETHERRLHMKERSAPYHCSTRRYQTGEAASDHSLSS